MNKAADKDERIEAILNTAPVVPVVTVTDVAGAVELARALVAGGLACIEVTLRTPKATEAIAAIAGEVEGAIVGAGTVLTPPQMSVAEKVGARFMVSPGASPGLLAAAADCPVPLLPGVATAGEMMALGEAGYRFLKFFPAGPAGGPEYLKSISAPLPQFRFCPTGGIGPDNAAQYLALPNVVCVGGSWVAPSKLMANEDWPAITALASKASRLARG